MIPNNSLLPLHANQTRFEQQMEIRGLAGQPYGERMGTEARKRARQDFTNLSNCILLRSHILAGLGRPHAYRRQPGHFLRSMREPVY